MKQGSQKEGHVYILGCGPLIRIGFSTDVKARVRALEHYWEVPDIEGAPDSLTLIASQPLKQSEERWLHMALARFRYRRSWYLDCGDLRKELIARGFELEPSTNKAPIIVMRTADDSPINSRLRRRNS